MIDSFESAKARQHPQPAPMQTSFEDDVLKPSPASLASHVSENLFLHVPQPVPPHPTVLFFIPGNPGLISYYHNFLSLLSTHPKTSSCIVVGFSLGGFEISQLTPFPIDNNGLNSICASPGVKPADPDRGYSLEEQIRLTYGRLRKICESVNDIEGSFNTTVIKVILVGHSVGAYIALECVRHHALYRAEGARRHAAPPGFEISGAILLTPSIVDIAKSRSGRILTAFITCIPRFARLVSSVVRLLVQLIPKGALEGLVGWVAGMPRGSSALEATICFLESGKCVRQCLELAADEMRTIKQDRWGIEVWGDAMQSAAGWGVKLMFYFADKDRWVADSTRTEIIKTRGRVDGERGAEWKPEIIIEKKDSVMHGWCIRHNEIVAERVIGWAVAMN